MKNTSGQTSTAGERGFSLIELLIAMVVTLIVGLAVVSLLLQGNLAFKIQPDMTERQQNIRAAMDLIMHDIQNAGAGLPKQIQVFTPGLYGAGVTAPSGTNSDVLELWTNDTGQDPLPVCGASGLNAWITPDLPTVIPIGTSVVLLMADGTGTYSWRAAAVNSDRTAGPASCGLGVLHPHLTLAPDVCGVPGNSVAGCTVQQVVFTEQARYFIRPDPTDSGMPVLWRHVPNGDQAVARGIEDMRVTYRNAQTIIPAYDGTDACADAACSLPLTEPAVATGVGNMLDALTVEVQVELAARGGLWTDEANPTSVVNPMMRREANGTYAYRGRLVSRGTPRAALSLLTDGRWK